MLDLAVEGPNGELSLLPFKNDMPDFSPDLAHRILSERARRKGDVTAFDQKARACEYSFDGTNSRWMVVSQDKHQNWVRVYVNRQSRLLEWFPVDGPSLAFPGVEVGFRYLKGYKGGGGYPGIAASAAKRRTLRPEEDHVLMLHCSSEEGFRELVRWYAGELSIGLGSPPSPDETSGEGWFQPFVRSQSASKPVDRAQATAPTSLPDPVAADQTVRDGQSDLAGMPDDLTSTDSTAARSSDQGWMQDPERRAAVESRAVELARIRYEQMHYDVVELGKPYDLRCTPTSRCAPGSSEIHVEVKGSVGSAETVIVTFNEVQHALEPSCYRADLVCVTNIVLVQTSDGSWRGTEGDLAFIENWRPAGADLQPTEYRYRLPKMTKA